ncbi:MAG: hypothetical protein Q7T16_03825 [Candidatus Burarchaeum sp.]|nr:hypothetical protein [Candidatus Burarchaeum sp.]MDO8339761.1 hypothetical protein [Candidatus Burarchaeum sp.]
MVEMRTAVLVLALLAIAGGAYYYFQLGGGPPAASAKNGTAILLSAVDAAAGVTTYVLVSGTSIDGAEPIVAHMVAKGESARVDINDSVGVLRSMYFLPDGDYICLPERKVCAEVEKNTTSLKLRNVMGYARGQIVKTNVTAVNDWINKKVIDVEPGTVERMFAGRRCEEIKYVVHLDLLSSEEIRGAGYDLSAAPYVRREITECLDAGAGFALHKLLNETLLGQSRIIELNVSKFEPRAEVKESEFALVGELASEQTYLANDDAEIERKSCMRLPTEVGRTECFKQKAVGNNDATYCGFVEGDLERDLCHLLLLPEWKNAAGCATLTYLKDDCYYEAALRFENSTLCGLVGGADRREACTTIFEGNATACLALTLADECTVALAGRLGDATICNQIRNATLRDRCLNTNEG